MSDQKNICYVIVVFESKMQVHVLTSEDNNTFHEIYISASIDDFKQVYVHIKSKQVTMLLSDNLSSTDPDYDIQLITKKVNHLQFIHKLIVDQK